MGMRKWETFLEDHIEGFFNKRFSSDLEPVELIKGLEKEIARQGSGKAQKDIPKTLQGELQTAVRQEGTPDGQESK